MNSANIQTAIRLVRVQFPVFNFQASERTNANAINEVQVNFEYDVRFFEGENNIFVVEFNLELQQKDALESHVTMIAVFEVEGTITEDFKNSDFVKTNAPAIAFPYLRSFVSTLTINAGFPPIVLPAVNLTKKAKNG